MQFAERSNLAAQRGPDGRCVAGLHGAETGLDSEVGRLRKRRSGAPLRILGEDLSPGVSRAWHRLGHGLERIGQRGAFSNSPLIARRHEPPSPQAAFFTE